MSSYLHHGSTDWANETHKRIVAASLVKGAYELESGRHNSDKQGIENAKSLAERFGFEIYKPIEDANDNSYFGAIFKYNKLPNCNSEFSPPKFVIAFRGTCVDPETVEEDLYLDVKFVLHRLHESKRCEQALHVVEEIISEAVGHQNVWLAGHSLGSAIALIAGRNMVVQKGLPLKAYLFNPPFFSYSTMKPFNIIYWLGRSVVTAGMGTLINGFLIDEEDKENLFNKLNSWSPHLFVNKRDVISNGYIWYFRQRKIMGAFGAGRIENVATQNSVISLLGKVRGRDYEPSHLIPSACLTKTKVKTRSYREAHGIKQWHGDINLSTVTKSYSFNNSI